MKSFVFHSEIGFRSVELKDDAEARYEALVSSDTKAVTDALTGEVVWVRWGESILPESPWLSAE